MRTFNILFLLFFCTLTIFAAVPKNPKRGVAFNLGSPGVYGGSTAADMQALAAGSVSWWYNWGATPHANVESINQTTWTLCQWYGQRMVPKLISTIQP